MLARGLAKEPAHRYASAADFVDALRGALDREAGTTRVGAIPPVVQPRGRRRVPLLLLLLAGALLAGILAAALLARDDGTPVAETTAPPPPPTTVQKTVTLPGTTVVQTVTTAAEPPPATTATPTTTAAPSSGQSPSALNDQGYELMRARRYEEALPLLEQAVAGLSGAGDLAEAYASYNLAFTRLALGRCDGVVELLNRSEQVQGQAQGDHEAAQGSRTALRLSGESLRSRRAARRTACS